ncbi:MAG: putative glycoside hydrolase [Chloroflexia bacterium]
MNSDAGRRGSLRLRSSFPAAIPVVGLVFLLVVVAGVGALWLGWFRPATLTAQESVTAQGTDPAPLIPGMPVCLPVPTNEGSMPVPTEPAPSRSVFGLAWFHKPPDDGTTPGEFVEHHSYVHLTGPADIPYRDELRDAGYKGPVYTYVTMNAIEGPGPYRDASASCDEDYTPYDNQLAFYKGDFCKYIHPNESWFLHNGAGARIVDDYFGAGRYSYVMNPADPGWRSFAVERLNFVKETWFYDGIWLDNVDVDRARVMSGLTNSDGELREYDSDDAWREAVKGWLAAARNALGDYPLWANLVEGPLRADAWDAYAPYLDGAMDESFAVRWIDGWRDPGHWQAQIQRAQRWLAMGKGLVAVGQGPHEDAERMRFALASYMLVAEGTQATFRYTRFDTYYSQFWLYPDYETARRLGAPLGSCREVSPNIWRRDFERGYVEVNVQGHEGRLVTEP